MSNKEKIAELEKKIGCGAPITTTFMAWPDEQPKKVNWYCGRYYGDDGPAYCKKCDELIEELWQLEEWE